MAAAGKKLEKSQGGYRMVPVEGSETSPFTLKEPTWIADNQCMTCIQCQGKFDFLNRKHHCRRCGRCFCNACCATKVQLHRMLFVDPVRHCARCSNISKKEQEFFERHIKTLTSGGTFNVTCQSDDNDNVTIFVCKLTQDHRYLHFENENRRLDAISLPDIDSLQVLATGPDPDEPFDIFTSTSGKGLAMQYKDSCGETQVIKMYVTTGPNKKIGQAWIASMQKAFKMIYESRGSSTP